MHWYIVADKKVARIFVKVPENSQLKLLQSLTNPLGTARRRDLIKKQAGRGVKSTGHTSSINYSIPKRHDPDEDAITQFSRELARFLESEKLKRNFDSMSVIASPHLLGKVKAEMSPALKQYVTNWIKKDLQKYPSKKLSDFLIPAEKSEHIAFL
ncbi:MAG: host attachment protein [Pseudomonadota bacterium]